MVEKFRANVLKMIQCNKYNVVLNVAQRSIHRRGSCRFVNGRCHFHGTLKIILDIKKCFSTKLKKKEAM